MQQQVGLQKPKCQAGGDCARTRAALNWPDHLPCVDPSKVSVPVDKSIALLKWFESLGHSVPELRELEAIKRRCAHLASAFCAPSLCTRRACCWGSPAEQLHPGRAWSLCPWCRPRAMLSLLCRMLGRCGLRRMQCSLEPLYEHGFDSW